MIFQFLFLSLTRENCLRNFFNDIIGRKMHNLRLGFQHWVHSQIIINDHKLKTVHQHLFLENLYIQLKFPHAHLGTWFPGSLWGTEAGVSQLNLVSRVTVGVGVHSWTWFPGSLWGWGFTVEPGFQGHSRNWGWGFTVEPGFQGHSRNWGWGFTVEPGFQGHCQAWQWNLVSRVHSPE